jgi:NAD(P)-dependent dehydrogenase (short-subunit alcohol dehydrogenase family)
MISSHEDMSGQAVLVTGSSGSIGRAVVSRLVHRGAMVVAVDRCQPGTPHDAAPAATALVDLTDDDATGRALSDSVPDGRLHHVIAVAGGGDLEELTATDVAQESLATFDRVVRNNLHVAFVTLRHAVPMMRRTTGDRSVTIVGSINAYGGYGAPGYSAAKAGLIGLAHALAPTLGTDGIRINCLTLGTVDTDNLRRLTAARGRTFNPADVAATTALRRVLTPDDVARTAVALATDLVGMTGANVVLDNGQLQMR